MRNFRECGCGLHIPPGVVHSGTRTPVKDVWLHIVRFANSCAGHKWLGYEAVKIGGRIGQDTSHMDVIENEWESNTMEMVPAAAGRHAASITEQMLICLSHFHRVIFFSILLVLFHFSKPFSRYADAIYSL